MTRALRVIGMTLLLVASAAAQTPSVRYGITKSKDTVTVGEPFSTRYLALIQSSPEIAAEHGRFQGVLNDIAAGR